MIYTPKTRRNNYPYERSAFLKLLALSWQLTSRDCEFPSFSRLLMKNMNNGDISDGISQKKV